MTAIKTSAFLLLTATTLISAAKNGSITAVSWGSPRVDIFGTANDKTIWHKYETGHGWEPSPGFEDMNATAFGYPVAVSWGQNRLDYFHIGKDNAAYHKYWDGTGWKPDGKYSERLKGEFSSGLAVNTWGPDRLDIVGRSVEGSYLHKAWTGSDWYPSGTEWDDLGGRFSSAPTIVSWSINRIDIFGIGAKDGDILHKYWKGDQWVPSDSWESLGGKDFIGDPLATSWGEGRFDVWVAGKDGQLNHKYYGGGGYSDWEQLGGNFATAPAVVHWDVNKIDIVGQFDGSQDTSYHSKAFDGYNWYPSFENWFDKGGDFATQPAVVANKGTNFLYVTGVDSAGKLQLQIWDGDHWQPAGDQYWSLGDTKKPYSLFLDFKSNIDSSFINQDL